MKEYLLKKKEQLNVDPGTAANKLRKSILFKYVCLVGDNVCYQCGKEIETEREFSIEHKIPWLDSDTPSELFYDLDNIGFSHLSCNVKAARKTRALTHPSEKAYKKGCRCDECKEIHRLRIKKQRDKRKK